MPSIPRSVKLIGFPVIVSGALLWRGQSHFKTSTTWPKDDVLLNVQIFHRHGDRTPVSLLRSDINKENELWADKTSKSYSNIKTNIPIDKMFQWNHIASRLYGSYIVNKQNNYDLNLDYLVCSKDNDSSTQQILSNIESWDWTYARKFNRPNWCGQLTDKGVGQLVDLGVWIRNRYINKFGFLSPVYLNNEIDQLPSIYYISTNYARTIQSADALLQGLYPLKHREGTSSIPVHVDNKVTWLYPIPTCKRFVKKISENKEKLSETDAPEMIELKSKLLEFYGQKDNDIEWLRVFEAVQCRLAHNIDLPDDISTFDVNSFINYVGERIGKAFSFDRDSMKLSMGVLLNRLVYNMNNLTNKCIIYSAHDGTILRLLSALSDGKKNSFAWPDYGASLIFEVWEKNIIDDKDKKNYQMSFNDWINGIDHSRKKYVRILYERKVLKINNKEFIPVEKLQQIWNDIMIDEETYWNNECVC